MVQDRMLVIQEKEVGNQGFYLIEDADEAIAMVRWLKNKFPDSEFYIEFSVEDFENENDELRIVPELQKKKLMK